MTRQETAEQDLLVFFSLTSCLFWFTQCVRFGVKLENVSERMKVISSEKAENYRCCSVAHTKCLNVVLTKSSWFG